MLTGVAFSKMTDFCCYSQVYSNQVFTFRQPFTPRAETPFRVCLNSPHVLIAPPLHGERYGWQAHDCPSVLCTHATRLRSRIWLALHNNSAQAFQNPLRTVFHATQYNIPPLHLQDLFSAGKGRACACRRFVPAPHPQAFHVLSPNTDVF